MKKLFLPFCFLFFFFFSLSAQKNKEAAIKNVLEVSLSTFNVDVSCLNCCETVVCDCEVVVSGRVKYFICTFERC